jgi:hypothetical protein
VLGPRVGLVDSGTSWAWHVGDLPTIQRSPRRNLRT